jgi:hypothetical protein
MQLTRHSQFRMSQRGISQRLVAFALQHGRVEGDRYVLDRREALRVVESLQADLRVAMHVLDKGGITVVEDHGNVVTTWNRDQPLHIPTPLTAYGARETRQ